MRITDLVKRGKFVITCEVDSPKGVNVENFLDRVDSVKDYVDAISVGDNRRAVMRAGPLAICHLLKTNHIEPIMELCGRDKNCLAVQSDLLAAAILGIENIVFTSGDDISLGDHAEATPVNELDSVSLVKCARTLTEGRDMAGHVLDEAPDFCFGVVVTPSLVSDGTHLEELKEAITQGAQFMLTETIYDPEVLERFVASVSKFKLPIIVGHTLLKSASMAGYLNSNFPGVTVSPKIIRELEGLSRDRLIETSCQISVEILHQMKPMCQGIHLVPTGWEKCVPRIVEALVG